MLSVNKEFDGNVMTMSLSGRLDVVSAPELKGILNDSLDGVERLVLDLEELEYTSSAGLRVFLEAYKTMAERDGMSIKNVNEMVMKVFDSVGFSKFMKIE